MIYFIGAGPGATDLITVRGMRLLQKADVVIYAGSLVNPELLDYCRPETTIYNSASMTLEQTVAAMRDAPRGQPSCGCTRVTRACTVRLPSRCAN